MKRSLVSVTTLLLVPAIIGVQSAGSAPTAPSIKGLAIERRPQISVESEDVSTFRGNAARTGAMPGPGPEGRIGELWHVDVGEAVLSSPIVVNDVVYVGTGSDRQKLGSVTALDAATGDTPKGVPGGPFWSTPLIVSDVLYAAGTDGYLNKIAATDGSILATLRPAPADSRCQSTSSPVAIDALVIVNIGCLDPGVDAIETPWSDMTGTLVALETDTRKIPWRFTMAGFSPTVSPAASDGLVVVAATTQRTPPRGTVHAVKVDTGDEVWRFVADTDFESTPAIAEGLVLVVGGNGELFALDLKTGSERWRFTLGDRSLDSPAVRSGVVYVGTSTQAFYAIDAGSGQMLWRASAPVLNLQSSRVVTVDAVYMGGSSPYLFVVDRDSGEVLSPQVIPLDPSHRVIQGPVTVTGGAIYYGTSSGDVIKLGDVRATVPIAEGLVVEVIDDGVELRAAPSNAAVVRGELSAGMRFHVTGPSEEREGQTWWPVDVPGVGSGWIPESAITAASGPSTAIPGAMSTPLPISTPIPTPTASPTRRPATIVPSDASDD
jgi:outer membrane protein assembly factor BamB